MGELVISQSALQQAADAAEGQRIEAARSELNWKVHDAVRKAEKAFFAEYPDLKAELAVRKDIAAYRKRDPVIRTLPGKLIKALGDNPKHLSLTNADILSRLSKNFNVKVTQHFLTVPLPKYLRPQVEEQLLALGLPTHWASRSLSKIKQAMRTVHIIKEEGGSPVNIPITLSTKHVIVGDKTYPIDKTGRVIVGRHRVSFKALVEMYDLFKGSEVPDFKFDG